MANKKSKPVGQKNWKNYLLIGGAVAFIFLAFVVYKGYVLYLDRADASRFMMLQSDFKKLQAEFNKIDPGWEYGEGCTAGGKLDDYKTCFVALSNKNVHDEASLSSSLEEYRESLVGFDVKVGQQSFVNDKGQPALNMQLEGRKRLEGILCDLSVAADKSIKNLSVYCRGSARAFYFERLDR